MASPPQKKTRMGSPQKKETALGANSDSLDMSSFDYYNNSNVYKINSGQARLPEPQPIGQQPSWRQQQPAGSSFSQPLPASPMANSFSMNPSIQFPANFSTDMGSSGMLQQYGLPQSTPQAAPSTNQQTQVQSLQGFSGILHRDGLPKSTPQAAAQSYPRRTNHPTQVQSLPGSSGMLHQSYLRKNLQSHSPSMQCLPPQSTPLQAAQAYAHTNLQAGSPSIHGSSGMSHQHVLPPQDTALMSTKLVQQAQFPSEKGAFILMFYQYDLPQDTAQAVQPDVDTNLRLGLPSSHPTSAQAVINESPHQVIAQTRQSDPDTNLRLGLPSSHPSSVQAVIKDFPPHQVTAQAAQSDPDTNLQLGLPSSHSTSVQAAIGSSVQRAASVCHSTRRPKRSSILVIDNFTDDDGYDWDYRGSWAVNGYRRVFYWCAHAGCGVTKFVERDPNGNISTVVYYSYEVHSHQKPRPNCPSYVPTTKLLTEVTPLQSEETESTSIRISCTGNS